MHKQRMEVRTHACVVRAGEPVSVADNTSCVAVYVCVGSLQMAESANSKFSTETTRLVMVTFATYGWVVPMPVSLCREEEYLFRPFAAVSRAEMANEIQGLRIGCLCLVDFVA